MLDNKRIRENFEEVATYQKTVELTAQQWKSVT